MKTKKLFNPHLALMVFFGMIAMFSVGCSRNVNQCGHNMLNAYVPGTVWEYAVEIDQPPFITIKRKEIWYISGSFSEEGKTYMKLYQQTTTLDFLNEVKGSVRSGKPIDYLSASTLYYGGVRNENGKLYYKSPHYPNELLMFDFSAHQGDTIVVTDISGTFYQPWTKEVPVWVKEISPSGFNGVEIMKVNTPPFDNTYSECWFRGIGSPESPVSSIYANYIGNGGSKLVKVTMCGKTVYESKRRQ